MVSRDLKKAREAFKKKDLNLMIEAHDAQKEEHEVSKGKYIKSVVYGGLDGIITTFAVMAGVLGAGLSSSVLLILGFANLIADGLSMGIGDYLSTKAQGEYYRREEKREKWEVKHNPKGEEKEMFEIYQAKGYKKEDAKQMVKLLVKNKKYWVEAMMHEELGLMYEDVSPTRNGIVTFFSFLFFGFVPLILFVISSIFSIEIPNSFLYASLLTIIALFSLGSMKSRLVGKKWYVSGTEMVFVGGLASMAAYLVGELLSTIV